jgi:hypothetical protein
MIKNTIPGAGDSAVRSHHERRMAMDTQKGWLEKLFRYRRIALPIYRML